MRDDTPSLFAVSGSEPTRVRFEPARLTQARVRRSVTKSDLAAEVGVSAAAIGQYEAGVNAPRADVLERLAKALDVRPGFFGVGRPLARIDTVNAHFRSLRSARVSDRHKALATATLLWELTFALERHVKLPGADLPEVEPGAFPAEAAALLRRHWGLPDGPVKHLVATAESRGIIVAVRPLAENVFKHRFSIAHEIGHLLLHTNSGEHSAAIEKEADEFAAAFLTPAGSMNAVLPQRLDLAALDRLGRTWGVSPTSLVRRMVERGRTTESSARRAYQRLSTVYDAKSDPTYAYPGEVPTLLTKAAELASDHGAPVPVLAETLKISAAEVRDLLGEADQRPILRLVGTE